QARKWVKSAASQAAPICSHLTSIYIGCGFRRGGYSHARKYFAGGSGFGLRGCNGFFRDYLFCFTLRLNAARSEPNQTQGNNDVRVPSDLGKPEIRIPRIEHNLISDNVSCLGVGLGVLVSCLGVGLGVLAALCRLTVCMKRLRTKRWQLRV